MPPRSADMDRMVQELLRDGKTTTPLADGGIRAARSRLHGAMTQAFLRPTHTMRTFVHTDHVEGRVYSGSFEGRSLIPDRSGVPVQSESTVGGKPSSPAVCHCGHSLWLIESRGAPIRRHNQDFYPLSEPGNPRYSAECAAGHTTGHFSSPAVAMEAARALANGDT